jgi:hypothetical protein
MVESQDLNVLDTAELATGVSERKTAAIQEHQQKFDSLLAVLTLWGYVNSSCHQCLSSARQSLCFPVQCQCPPSRDTRRGKMQW